MIWKENKSERKNKEKIFEDFFKENYSRLFYFALQYIPDSEACKDIISDSFQTLWVKFNTIKTETMRSYMYTNVRNQCIDSIRHRKVVECYKDYHKQTNTTAEELDHEAAEARIQKIMRLMGELPLQTKFIMEQNYLHQKKYREIAAIVGLSESGVKKHIMKGLDIIRKEFSVKYKKGSN